MLDYKELELAHQMAEKAGVKILYAYQNKSGSFVHWIGIEQLSLEMKELTQPKPKYEIGQEVWFCQRHLNTDFLIPVSFKIRAIYPNEYNILYCGEYEATEENLFSTREDLIKHQIQYWEGLRVNGILDKDDANLSQVDIDINLQQSGVDRWQHESDGTWCNGLTCIKCREYY